MALLSDLKARNIKPNSPAISHGGVPGLSLIPSSSSKGRGKWVLRYTSPTSGKRRNTGLGSYPEISIAQAAKIALTMREQLAQGIDPLELKRQEESAAAIQQSVPTFAEAAERLHTDSLPGWKNAKHGQQWINTITEYAFPTLGAMRIDTIEPKDIAATLQPIWLKKPETASRLKQRIHAVMAWGWAHRYCASNPVDVVEHLLPSQPNKVQRTQHHPAMPWHSIPAFIKDHVRKEPGDVTRSLLEFLILTATRSGEARKACWGEIDFQNAVWTIPADRMKSGVLHRVPLSHGAINLLRYQKLQLKQMHNEGKEPELHQLIFPSPRKGVALSDMVLTSFLRRHKIPSNTAERTATAHGFRSSFRDWCSEHEISRDVAERALAHTVKNQVEAAYHRTDLLEQRRKVMQRWYQHVCAQVPDLPDGRRTLADMFDIESFVFFNEKPGSKKA